MKDGGDVIGGGRGGGEAGGEGIWPGGTRGRVVGAGGGCRGGGAERGQGRKTGGVWLHDDWKSTIACCVVPCSVCRVEDIG